MSNLPFRASVVAMIALYTALIWGTVLFPLARANGAVTATVTPSAENIRDNLRKVQAAPKVPAVEGYTISLTVRLHGGDVPLFRKGKFATEAECVAFLKSAAFFAEMVEIAEVIASRDPNGSVTTDPHCTEVTAPQRSAD